MLRGEAARLLGVDKRTLAAWEQKGDVIPERTATGVRVYDRATIERLAAERASK
jgi:DNA-binding transcriptional MerR regulator